ncbi:MAG: aminopeptidase [Dehalobacterium sp.]
MGFLYEYELGKAADVLVNELFKVREGETFVITADSKSDERVVNATARSIFAAGGKPMIIWTATPYGPGKQTDDFLPSESIRAALLKADCWIEYNTMYLLYSETYEIVAKNNKNLRFLCLPAMHTDVFVRLFARTDHAALKALLDAVVEKIKKAKHVRITTPAGEDVEFDNHPDHPVNSRNGYADKPGTHMLSGMVSWAPDLDTVNGVIVFDGSLVPQFGVLETPVKVYMKNGVIDRVEGGRIAEEWEKYMRSFNHPQMLRPAHVCCGFHPQAKLTGQIGEDERLWGGSQWGFGAVGSFLIPPAGIPAPSHIDGTCLNASIYLDGVQITNNGQIVDPDLQEYAKKLGK